VDQQVARVVRGERDLDARLGVGSVSDRDLGEQGLGRQPIEALGRVGPYLEAEVTGVIEGLKSLAQGLLLRDGVNRDQINLRDRRLTTPRAATMT
jgi:hypothetical protein